MKISSGLNKTILKNAAIILAVAAITAGATYSYLSNPVKVLGNNFSTGSADLKIKMPGNGCPNWSDSCAGKTWTALYPGWHDSYEVYLKNESASNIALEAVPFIEETGSSADLWNKSFMEITWSDGSHSTGRYSLTNWKTNSTIKLLPVLAQGQEAGPWVVKFDIDTTAGNEIANASIAFNVVFDGVQAGGSGGGASAVCGNGILEGSEVCDDGNTTNGDGCTSACQSEVPGCTPSAEACDGIDNNCNGIVDENLGGGSCDGLDSDLCAEGTYSCVAGALVCSDNTGSTLDICNGSDDDCDAASSDGSEDPLNGTACDGIDNDLCSEGTRSCLAGALVCSDNTGSTLDICNGSDDDCDIFSADGSEDPLNGTACDGSDTDLCSEGTRSCLAGALSCSDATGNSSEICGDGIDNDCDGATDEPGCV